MTDNPLTGRRILVAEDEYVMAMDLTQELAGMGAIVIGPAPSVERAVDLIECTPCIDAAILDINLGGEMIFPAADRLCARGVPFLFTTGYDQSIIPARFCGKPRCEKPVGSGKLCRVLARIIPAQTA